MKSSITTTAMLTLMGVALGVGGYAFLYAKGYSYILNDPAACSNCHAMRTQYEAWMKSSHHSAATCNDCHTPRNIFGKYAVKASNGFFHSLYFTTGRYPDTIQISRFDRAVTEGACRRCHQNITSAIDGNVAHGKAEGLQRFFNLRNTALDALMDLINDIKLNKDRAAPEQLAAARRLPAEGAVHDKRPRLS